MCLGNLSLVEESKITAFLTNMFREVYTNTNYSSKQILWGDFKTIKVPNDFMLLLLSVLYNKNNHYLVYCIIHANYANEKLLHGMSHLLFKCTVCSLDCKNVRTENKPFINKESVCLQLT